MAVSRSWSQSWGHRTRTNPSAPLRAHQTTEARERQAESLERQDKDLAVLRRSVLLSARVQLAPTGANRTRLQAFLSLIESARPPEDDRL